MMECRRGDIYFVDFGRDTESSLQCGIRPALVVSNNRANENSPVITVIPLTGRTYKRPHFPTQPETVWRWRSRSALLTSLASWRKKEVLQIWKLWPRLRMHCRYRLER